MKFLKNYLMVLVFIFIALAVLTSGIRSDYKNTVMASNEKAEEIKISEIEEINENENNRKKLDKANGVISGSFGYYEDEPLFCQDNNGRMHESALIGFDASTISYNCESYRRIKGEVFVPQIYNDSSYVGYLNIYGDDNNLIFSSGDMCGSDKAMSLNCDISRYETVTVEIYALYEHMENRSPALDAYFE